MNVNFELRDLRLFVSVIDNASFRKAAEQNNISQPALSRRIQSLETSFGAVLLERSTRQVALTPYGREVEVIARRTIHELEFQLAAISRKRSEETGLVKVSCLHTTAFQYLPYAIEKFGERFPNIRFKIFEAPASQALAAVRNKEVDIGINFFGFSDESLSYTPLLDDPFMIAIPPGHRFMEQDAVQWSDLQGERLIGVNRESSNRILIDSNLSKSGIYLDWFYELTHSATSIGLVERGIGIAVLPKIAMSPSHHQSVKMMPLINPVITRAVGLVQRRDHMLPFAAQSFRDFLLLEANAG
ncbi:MULTISPECIES: LysR family transcriptional regulator [Shinella]|uniref:LysR family transcriptional regulator n=1 Tax=Shinella sedimenti TaxID=2919913 RepID=A0ABT0CNT5_9HYPH|nr:MULTISPECIES: LysR family transcriptional regulator [Shinella]MCJ8150252.1 LysR family transcriptional regulator [Shinella sedimenti]